MQKKVIELVVNTALLLRAYALGVFTLMLAATGFAFAQAAVLPNLDPTGWGGSPFVFGAAITLIIATVKRWVEQKNLSKYGYVTGNPWLWRSVALALGIGGAFGLNIAKYGAELLLFGLVSPWSVVLFGLASALVAMGYRDLLKQALGWVGGTGAVPPVLPAPDAGNVGASPSGFEPLPFAAFGIDVPLSLDGLVEVLLGQMGLAATPARLFRIGAKLAVTVPDLLDGDPHLSSENRARILNVIMDLKQSGGLA